MPVIYVNMQDRFLSGWGKAAGGRALYSVKCESRVQAEAIAAAAEDRGEMIRVATSDNPRRARPGDHLRIVPFAELGGVWLKYYDPRNEDS